MRYRQPETVSGFQFRSCKPIALIAACAAVLVAAAFTETALAAKKPKRALSSSEPMTVVVDLGRQRAVAYRGTKPVFSSRISSGKRGHRTPTGVFSIIQKRRKHFSNLYNDAPMPNMQRLTWSGIALHGGPVPNYPASHGCVRLPYRNARRLFNLTRMNARVVVAYSSPRPTLISHELLWNRLPAGDDTIEELTPIDGDAPTVAPSVSRPSKTGPQNVVNAVLGVSEAQAAGGPLTEGQIRLHSRRLAVVGDRDGEPRTRASVERRELARIEGLKMVQDGARQRHRLAKALLDARVAKSRQLSADLRGARKVHARATRHLNRWNKRTARATRKLNIFLVARVSTTPDDPAFQRLANEEAMLEDRLTDADTEQEFAVATEAQTGHVLSVIEAKLGEVRAQAKQAASSYRAAKVAYTKSSRAVAAAEKAFDLRERPVHVLISRQTQKLYVRQGYQPIFEADIEVVDPETPLGTHVMSAVGEAEDGHSLRWTAMSVPDRRFKAPVVGKRKGREVRRFETRAALDRVMIPSKVRERVEELVKVGSSVIVSDRGPSHETGKGTDFVILTR